MDSIKDEKKHNFKQTHFARREWNTAFRSYDREQWKQWLKNRLGRRYVIYFV